VNSIYDSSLQSDSRWGLLGTVLWTGVVAVAFVVTQIVAAIVFVSVSQNLPDPSQIPDLKAFTDNGDVLAVSTWATFFVCGFLVLVAITAKPGSSLSKYLALKPVTWRVLLAGVAALLCFLFVLEAVNSLFERPIPESMLLMYRSAQHQVLFWTAIVIAAPVFEEVFFRGFLHSSLERSFLGVTGTILITAMFWSVIHFQYDTYEVIVIFIMGLLLGISRWLTGSLYVPILIHALNNFVSNIQIAYLTS